jgi:HD-GYP domain-containing protein (c-di-GMP phosphodiesterase class II)
MGELDDTTVEGPAGATVAAPDAAGATVEALARALELHDYRRGAFGENAVHTARVTRLGLSFTRVVAPQLAADPQLAYGFRLHDIGMIGVASSTLLKQGELGPDELAEIREHPWLGERIVAPVPSLGGVARQVIASHHERWDGAGYPRGLAGTEIALAARIFAVVDAIDAMTHGHSYRDPLPVELALAEIDDKAGSHFDPEVARKFVEIWPQLQPERAPPATD